MSVTGWLGIVFLPIMVVVGIELRSIRNAAEAARRDFQA